MTVALAEARGAFLASVEQFMNAAESASEWDLLGSSRCHGWSRMDVVSHVLAGWQEMLGGFVASTDACVDVDAATYWTAFAEGASATDPVQLLMAQRRRTDAYTRPSSLTAQLGDVAAMLNDGAAGLGEGNLRFQRHVMTSGDFLAIWAVENAIHHVDLDLATPVASEALRLARRTCDALSPSPFPREWTDVEVVLVASGRVGREDVPAQIAEHLPVI